MGTFDFVGTFDFIDFDETTLKQQEQFKEVFSELERGIRLLPPGRARAIAITHMEEAYMWIGKALRDTQLDREFKLAGQQRY